MFNRELVEMVEGGWGKLDKMGLGCMENLELVANYGMYGYPVPAVLLGVVGMPLLGTVVMLLWLAVVVLYQECVVMLL